MIKHAPSMEQTLDSITQGASLFLDPNGAQAGEEIQGEVGIVYGDLDLNQCVEPKQFHDTVGYYQRFDVFDLKVNRRRQGADTAFETETEEVTARGVETPLPRNTTAPGRNDAVDSLQLSGRGGM